MTLHAYKATLTIPLPQRTAINIAEGLTPELRGAGAESMPGESTAPTPPTDRLAVMIEADPEGLLVTIDAKDISALQAGLNSYLRWIQLSMDVHHLATDTEINGTLNSKPEPQSE